MPKRGMGSSLPRHLRCPPPPRPWPQRSKQQGRGSKRGIGAAKMRRWPVGTPSQPHSSVGAAGGRRNGDVPRDGRPASLPANRCSLSGHRQLRPQVDLSGPYQPCRTFGAAAAASATLSQPSRMSGYGTDRRRKADGPRRASPLAPGGVAGGGEAAFGRGRLPTADAKGGERVPAPRRERLTFQAST